MILTTPSVFLLPVHYITDTGMLRTELYEAECFINCNDNPEDTWQGLVDNYKNSITLIRGYSQTIKTNKKSFETSKMELKTTGGLTYHNPMMPYLGSIKECIENSLKNEMCTMMSTVGNVYSNAYVNLNKVDTSITITHISKNGLQFNNYDSIEYEFEEDRSMTCTTCMSAFKQFEEILSNFNTSIFFGKKDTGFNIKSDFAIKLDTDYSDDNVLAESIFNQLYGIAKDAKIKSIKFNAWAK